VSIQRRRRLACQAAVALFGVALVAATAGAANAQVVTTTTADTVTTTSTTVPIPQTTIHGSSSDKNNCVTSLDPPINPDAPSNVTATVATDAFPQPHLGDPIKLTNTKVTVAVPASVLQQGVDLGFIHDGDKVPSTLTFSVNGAGTTEGSHTYTVSSIVTIHIVGGIAQELKSTLAVPNTTWHPINDTTNVSFSEKHMVIVSTLDLTATLGFSVTATFTCDPSSAPAFVSVGAQGVAPPPTTTIATTTTLAGPATTAAAVPVGTTALPRTGSSSSVLFGVAVACLSLGLFALRATRRKRVTHTS
jgi:LPXTG-motif cell wall-anchored protein